MVVNKTVPTTLALDTRTVGLSPRTLRSTVVATLLGVAVAILNATSERPELLAFLPVWAQTLVLLAVPPILVGLTAYQAPNGAIDLDDARVEVNGTPVDPTSATVTGLDATR